MVQMQNSILGPKLFILYINDMCNISNVIDLIIFADDTNIFSTTVNIANKVPQLVVYMFQSIMNT